MSLGHSNIERIETGQKERHRMSDEVAGVDDDPADFGIHDMDAIYADEDRDGGLRRNLKSIIRD